MYLYPDQATAKENARDRVLPMITSSPRLRNYLTGAQDDMGQERINLLHMPIYFAWAGSASRMANKPCRYVVQDETDKYPETAAKSEADPSSLVEKRLTTYRRSGKAKNFRLSTPTVEGGVIWRALTGEAQVIFDYWVRCPACGGWRSRGERPVGLATYLEGFRPKKIGFHLPAWISSFVTLSECAAAFFRGQGDRNKLKDFCNNYKAEPWLAYEQSRSEDALLMLRDERPSGVVPGQGRVACLVAGVDTQDNGFWFEVRAFSYGQQRESWQVRAGFVDSFAALAEVLWGSEYRDGEGNSYFLRLAVMDAMGHRTDEVYAFARANLGRLFAFQGVQRLAQPYRFSAIDNYPGTGKAIPGGLKILRADVNYFKNILSSKLEIAAGDPGAWHFNAETTPAWARQMTVEYIDEKTGLWACPENKANHAWDCSVYALVAAEVLGVRYWPRPGEAPAKPPPAAARQQTERVALW
jgi:phage terminase large subunit GpA-like protein